MEVIVNNKHKSIPHDYKLTDLLNELKFHKSVAVFINNRQMLYSEYDDCKLQDKDIIRIIRPLGGG